MMTDLGQSRMGPWVAQLEYGPPKSRQRCYQTLTNVCQSLKEVATMDDEGLSPEVASPWVKDCVTVDPDDDASNTDGTLEYLTAMRTAEERRLREELSRNGPFGGQATPVEYQGDTKAPSPYERQEEVEDPTARPTKSDEVAERHEKQEKEHQERENQNSLQECQHRLQKHKQDLQERVLKGEQVDVIMQKEKTHEFKDNESAPTYTRMMRKHLSLESLRIFEIDYTIDDQVRFPPRL